MCKALLYYLAQTWTADRYWQAHRDEPARAAGRARHSRPSRAPLAPAGSRPWWRAAAHRAGRRQPMTGIPPLKARQSRPWAVAGPAPAVPWPTTPCSSWPHRSRY